MNSYRVPKKESKFIVLTDNFYLYQGIANLIPWGEVLHIDLSANNGIPNIPYNKRTIILIDSLTFLSGNWVGFHELVERYPASSIVWLTREETGNVFPCKREGDLLLAQKSQVNILRVFLYQMMTLPETLPIVLDVVQPFILTTTEKDILFNLVYGKSLFHLARKRKVTLKTIYHHQRSILIKSGFKSVEFLRHIISHNKSVFNSQWWWSHVYKR